MILFDMFLFLFDFSLNSLFFSFFQFLGEEQENMKKMMRKMQITKR